MTSASRQSEMGAQTIEHPTLGALLEKWDSYREAVSESGKVDRQIKKIIQDDVDGQFAQLEGQRVRCDNFTFDVFADPGGVERPASETKSGRKIRKRTREDLAART